MKLMRKLNQLQQDSLSLIHKDLQSSKKNKSILLEKWAKYGNRKIYKRRNLNRQ